MAAAAPEVPAAVLFVFGVLAFLTFLILLLLRLGANVLIRGLIGALAKFLPSWFGIRHDVEKGIAYVANAVDDVLGTAASATQGVGIAAFHDAWKLTRMVGHTIADLAHETAHRFRVIEDSLIPGAILEPIRRLRGEAAALERELSHLEGQVTADLRKGIGAAEAAARTAEAALAGELATAEHAITTTIPNELNRVQGDIRGWTSKQLRRLSRRLSAVEEAVGLTALAGVIVGVIAREIPWVRCRNVGKVGKALCGLPVRWLEALLSDAIEALVVGDLCQLIVLMSAAAEEFEPVLLAFVDVEDALIGCHGITRPPNLGRVVPVLAPVAQPIAV